MSVAAPANASPTVRALRILRLSPISQWSPHIPQVYVPRDGCWGAKGRMPPVINDRDLEAEAQEDAAEPESQNCSSSSSSTSETTEIKVNPRLISNPFRPLTHATFRKLDDAKFKVPYFRNAKPKVDAGERWREQLIAQSSRVPVRTLPMAYHVFRGAEFNEQSPEAAQHRRIVSDSQAHNVSEMPDMVFNLLVKKLRASSSAMRERTGENPQGGDEVAAAEHDQGIKQVHVDEVSLPAAAAASNASSSDSRSIVERMGLVNLKTNMGRVADPLASAGIPLPGASEAEEIGHMRGRMFFSRDGHMFRRLALINGTVVPIDGTINKFMAFQECQEFIPFKVPARPKWLRNCTIVRSSARRIKRAGED